MPRDEVLNRCTPVTRSQLVSDLRRLGLRPGMTAMVHTSMRSLGWVSGGSQTVIEALLEALAPEGTLCAQTSWEDIPFGLADWPRAWREAYESELPSFDPTVSAAAPYEGRIAERIRTWPGARRSANPATGIAAVGRDAAALTANHRLDDGFGADTPYSRVVDASGVVLVLGAPLHSISLLHHAEAIARAPKRWTTYRLPVVVDGARRWVEIRELDVWRGAFPYARVCDRNDRPLAAIAASALAAGIGRHGLTGGAEAYLFPAPELTAYAAEWLEARFAKAPSRRSAITR